MLHGNTARASGGEEPTQPNGRRASSQASHIYIATSPRHPDSTGLVSVPASAVHETALLCDFSWPTAHATAAALRWCCTRSATKAVPLVCKRRWPHWSLLSAFCLTTLISVAPAQHDGARHSQRSISTHESHDSARHSSIMYIMYEVGDRCRPSLKPRSNHIHKP